MVMIGGLTMLALVSLSVMAMAGIGLYRLRLKHAQMPTLDPSCRQLERDIVMAIGMTMAVWAATALALLVNPELGSTPLLPGSETYSIARGTVMLAFGHCVGWGGFLLRRALYWERPTGFRATP